MHVAGCEPLRADVRGRRGVRRDRRQQGEQERVAQGPHARGRRPRDRAVHRRSAPGVRRRQKSRCLAIPTTSTTASACRRADSVVAGHPVTREPRICGACGAKNRPAGVNANGAACRCRRGVLTQRRSGPEGLVATTAGRAVAAIVGIVAVWRRSGDAIETCHDCAAPAKAAVEPVPRRRPESTSPGRPRTAPGAAILCRSRAGDFARRGAESVSSRRLRVRGGRRSKPPWPRDPDDPDALNNLGQALVRLDRAQEADSSGLHRRCSWRRRNGPIGSTSPGHAASPATGPAPLRTIVPPIGCFPDDHATLFNLALALRKAGRPRRRMPILEQRYDAGARRSFLCADGGAHV